MKDTHTRQPLALRRIKSFEKRFGIHALTLACHAAFPLALTPNLLYCLREVFVQDCGWISVPDILLSSLCSQAGYELYAIEDEDRDLLLQHLASNENGKQRLYELADYMSQYMKYHSRDDSTRHLFSFERPYWTALAYTEPNTEKLKAAMKEELDQLLFSADTEKSDRGNILLQTYSMYLEKHNGNVSLPLMQDKA